MKFRESLALFCFLGVPLSALSAVITWEAPMNVSAASDVATDGVLVEAFNAGSTTVSDQTVNGVLFTGTGALLHLDNAGDFFAGDTGDAAYNALLGDMDFGGGSGLVELQTGGGNLVSGSLYQVQVWYVDSSQSRTTPVGDGETPNNTVDLSSSGQFATGTFTADSANQTLTLESPGFGNAHITAYQIRSVGVVPAPEVPTGLTAMNGFTAEISLDWDDNNQVGFSHFIVKRSLSSSGPFVAIAGATPVESEYIDTGLSIGTTYHYVVSAVNIASDESSNSTHVSLMAQVFVPDAPTVPTGLSVRPGNTRNHLQWDMNTQMGFKEFRVKRSTSFGGSYAQITSGTNTSFIDSGLTNDIPYYYVVTAVNSDDVESAPCPVESGTPSLAAVPPNFLFIIADDMDTYAVNAYRETEPAETDANGDFYAIDTPNMDRLADEGMLFHQARLMGADRGAVCTPSRATIMTGRNTWQREDDPTAETTFPGIFNRGVRSGAGDLPHVTYRTCKNGNSYPTANAEFQTVNDATKRGNTDGSGSEWHGDWGIDYIEDWNTHHRTNDTPFLIYLGFSHPHDERNAREDPDLTGRYNCINTTDPASIVLNTNAPPLPYNHLSCTPATYPAHPFDHGGLTIRDEISVPGILQYRTEAVVRNEIGRNFACVDWIDQQMGRVLEQLDDPNGDGDTSDSVLDNTYIVFTADHGIAIGRHGLQGKQNLYEHTWRVPYIVRGPGIAAGTESDALIYLHDTFPTFCDLAGIDLPYTIDSNDGQSFREVLEGTANEHRDVLYGLYAGSDKPGIRAVTDGRFKLMKYDVGENDTQVTQLFDLEQNPFELLPEHGVTNLALEPAYALIRQQLEEKLMEKRIEFADPYSYLGDRTLFRFEDDLADRLPFGHDGTAPNGVSFSTEVPDTVEYVVGETNTTSLDLEQDLQQYVEVSSGTGLNFGDNPFTIEAWVKLETLPTSDDVASAMPLVQKKVIGENDSELDYLFLAAAGNYGSASTYNCMALHLGSASIISALAIPDTEWHYISVSLDPNSDTVRFQLDELTDIQSTTAFGTANDGPLIIGAHYTSAGAIDSTFDGLIDELSITDGFLADAELQPLQDYPEPLPAQLYTPTISAEGVSLSFDSNSAFLYDVESKERLMDPEWILEQSLVWDAGDTISVDLGSTTSTSMFYRVKTNGPYDN